ncbi:O-methyltransferase [Tardiphaga sp. 768_D3_N2_1]|uniref:O-methyltransferase n=1 Tax=Tardiphaga sp. 768_D3_N2_1 TaxID=3240783 RepID=UPI003F894817
MSGADIPYQLRPNKFVDRQLFVELLSRTLASRGIEKYIYVSMGGRHLIDHHAMYSKLGVQALFSFDIDPNEVARQRINRPTGGTICVEMNSADLPSEIDSIMARFPSKENVIVWLDYTTPDRRTQLQEAIQTMTRLRHGDIFRITLNADPRTLKVEDWNKNGSSGPAEYRAELLRAQIAEYMPTHLTAISKDELASALALSFELAASAAEGLANNLRFVPLLVTSYSDGTPMLTITCAVQDTNEKETFPTTQVNKWKFTCAGWRHITQIKAPLLSLKEQYRLDANLHRGAKRMLSGLRFLPAVDEELSLSAIKSYRLLHRYYPQFRNVED